MNTGCGCDNNKSDNGGTRQEINMEDYVKQQAAIEDKVDYEFIQRIIQELTQSCALPVAIPASSIPPLILQAAQYFWENSDQAVEERYYCLKNSEFKRCGPNLLVKLPEQIISVFGVYKLSDSHNYGVLGDFSLERMILNNNGVMSGLGGGIGSSFTATSGYSLVDLTASLYEISTFKALFQSPVSYNYNQYSNQLIVLGDIGYGDLCLQVFQRCKIQDLYKNYYFFRYCICLAKRALSTIYGTFEFKLPGGIAINYTKFSDDASQEMDKIDEWINKNHAADYFFNSNTI